jgi:MoaA/NifB/PqqE/SkfB family radical SAM enzyme
MLGQVAGACCTKDMGRVANLLSLAGFAVDFVLLRRDHPYVLGLAVTDRCNLRCRHCRVWDTHAPHLSYDQIDAVLRDFHGRGARLLYLEGGEPYLWRDGDRRLADVIALARQRGFLRVHVYTNGTLPIAGPADFTWVSADGLPATNQRLRGSSLETVFRHLCEYGGRKALLFTVNSINRHEVRPFLALAREVAPGVPVMFYLHTPYYGVDELHLDDLRRDAVVDELLACKRDGLPVMNSTQGLERLRPGAGSGPSGLWWVVDRHGEYRCCRALGDPEICRYCGYAACEEILLARNLAPGPVLSLLRCAGRRCNGWGHCWPACSLRSSRCGPRLPTRATSSARRGAGIRSSPPSRWTPAPSGCSTCCTTSST